MTGVFELAKSIADLIEEGYSDNDIRKGILMALLYLDKEELLYDPSKVACVSTFSQEPVRERIMPV